MNKTAPDLVNLVIVPNQESQAFGSLYEIKSEADEIFISAATVDDIAIIDAITASKLKASGNVVTTTTSATTGVTSGATYTTGLSNHSNPTSNSKPNRNLFISPVPARPGGGSSGSGY